MSKFGGNVVVEWGRLAGDEDEDGDGDDGQADKSGQRVTPQAPPDPTASADVVVSTQGSAVSWRATVEGVPIEISVRALVGNQAKGAAVVGGVAKQVQMALRTRALQHGNPQVRAVLSALVPPQARAAVKAVNAVVSLARSGKLRSLFHRLRGGARVIARSLMEAQQ